VCTSSTRRPHPLEGNPKKREEAEVGDQEGLTLHRETLRQERRLKLETGKERRAQQRRAGTRRLQCEREREGGVKGTKLKISMG
jgi:hypothetical protein